MSKMSREAASAVLDQVAERMAEIKRLEDTFGAEPAEGAMLRVFRDISGRTYTYAAIRADNGRWYLTGRQYGDRGWSWDDLLDLFGGWTLRHYEVIPAPVAPVLPDDATYPCGHTDAEHLAMFSHKNGSPLSFSEFLKSQGFGPAMAGVTRVGSLSDLFKASGFPFPGTDGDNSYDNEGSHVDEPVGAHDPDSQ